MTDRAIPDGLRPGNSVRLAALAMGLAALASAGSLLAQVTVDTLGGGPTQTNPFSSSGDADGSTFNDSQFNNPVGAALDSAGNLYIADRNNSKVRKISRPGDTANSLTTSLIIGLDQPVAVAVDAGDNLYVLTAGDGLVRKYSPAGALLGFSATGLTGPTALTLDANTNLYITLTGGSVLRITPAGAVSTLSSAFSQPQGIALFDNTTLVVSDSGTHALRLLSVSGGAPTLLAGGNGAGFTDGPNGNARFNSPAQIARAPSGAIVVADRLNHRVRVVDPGGFVATLYGVDTNEWANSPFPDFPGWLDGGTNAHAREPVGITVATSGNVFVTEVFYDIIRMVSGTGLGLVVVGGGGGSSNPPPVINLGVTNVSAAATFGFQSGEASSDFVGAAGQRFYAPVTLTVLPGINIVSLQFNLATTPLIGPPVTQSPGFESMLLKPKILNPAVVYEQIPPAMFSGVFKTNIDFATIPPGTNLIPILTNLLVTNVSQSLLGVGWLESPGHTNLYDTTAQDLISFSQAFETFFRKTAGKVILGGYSFVIPPAAPADALYQIQLGRASATTNGFDPIVVSTPTGGSLTNGPINSVKIVSIGSRGYLVGDIRPFRWFNAGDFGDGNIYNDDIMSVFRAVIYGFNHPPPGSDLFGAMDSSNGGGGNNLANGDDTFINTIAFGDGQLNVDDIFVTFRRSLDPSLTHYRRFWAGGTLNAITVSNLFNGAPNSPAVQFSSRGDSPATLFTTGSSEAPSVTFVADDIVLTGSSRTAQVPIRAKITGGFALRVLALNLWVEPLDGSPPVAQPVQFTVARALGSPTFSDSIDPGNYAAVWLNDLIQGVTGTNVTLGTLQVTLPPEASSSAAYRVRFEHASGSPNGFALLPAQTQDGVVSLSDRSVSSLGDAIPDTWRFRFFGTLTDLLSAATADADGDGVPNWAEFLAGTNPRDAESRLHLRSEILTNNPGLALRWRTAWGKRYALECSDRLGTTNWLVLSTNLAGNGTIREFIETNLNNGAQFYRVRVLP